MCYGSEYLFAGFLDDALKLNGRNALNGRSSRVIRAQPYNAAAKPVEGWFHHIEGHYLAHIQGWHGGKLGAPRRPARGKLPAPFEGGFEAFCKLFFGLLRSYEVVEQQGQLKGLSPRTCFERHVQDGWAATIMEQQDVLSVFCRTETRVVRQHGLSLDGRTWNCRELDAYFDRTVTVKVPVLGLGFNELWVGDAQGEFIGIARPDVEHRFDDTRQAQHSSDRKSAAVAAVRRMQKSLPTLDVADQVLALGTAEPPIAVNAPIGTVSVAAPAGAASAVIPKARSGRDRDEEIRARNARQFAAIEEVERQIELAKGRKSP